MSFHVLGPVELEVEGVPVDLGPVKQRTVLAALLLEPGRQVSTQDLAERVWGRRPPADVRNSLYTYVARLRRVLRAASAACPEPVELLHRGGGYRLTVDPHCVDLHLFRGAVARAVGEGRQEDEERAAALREALALWRGTPLAGLPGPWAGQARRSIERQYVEVLVQQAELESRLGLAAGSGDALRDALVLYPLADPALGRLMAALDRAGRSADALDAFSIVQRRRTAEGEAPVGPDLMRLQQAIRDGAGPARTVAVPRREDDGPATDPGGIRVVTTPDLLPADLADFTGRDREQSAVGHALLGLRASAPPVVVLVGGPGTGKSALAVHASHQVRRFFPGGQLYLDLQGSGTPVTPDDALRRLLRPLGASVVPSNPRELAELYRDLLTRRQVLILLDDALDETQVRPLVPGSQQCALLITSRSLLPGMACERIAVERLPTAEGVRLLAGILGRERVETESRAAAEVVTLCDGLPLALRAAASRLVARPHWSVQQLVTRLRPADRRLDELAHGGHAVREALDDTYGRLDPQARGVLLRLASGGAPGATTVGLAAQLGIDHSDAEEVLDRLADAHVLDVVRSGQGRERRYDLPTLTRLHALERGAPR